jgi:Na+/melibiose symporter-like transporter
MRENKKLYIYLIAFAVFGVSIQVFMPYLILYYTVSLKMDNYVFIMAPAIILAAVFTAFWGRVYDKVKFKKSVFPALALLILGYVILYFFRGTEDISVGHERFRTLISSSPRLSWRSCFAYCSRRYSRLRKERRINNYGK